MEDMYGLVVLSCSRSDGSRQKEESEQGGAKDTRAETIHGTILLSVTGQYRTRDACLSVTPITSSRNSWHSFRNGPDKSTRISRHCSARTAAGAKDVRICAELCKAFSGPQFSCCCKARGACPAPDSRQNLMCNGRSVWHLSLPWNSPTAGQVFESDSRVVTLRGGRRNQNQGGVISGCLMGFFYQACPNSLSLIFRVNREVREIATVAKVGYRARDSDKLPSHSGGDNQVGTPQHCFEPIRIVDRASLGQSGADEDLLKLRDRELGLKGINKGHWIPC